ncbi:hypothetical protein [Methylobacterium oxalidis]
MLSMLSDHERVPQSEYQRIAALTATITLKSNTSSIQRQADTMQTIRARF